MKTLKTVCLSLGLVAVTAVAEPDLTYEFAKCTGRLSAQMEHQWLMQDPGAVETEARRQAMADLLVAMTESQPASDILAVRIEAKFAHASLLTRASFNDDAEDALWAQQRVDASLAECAGFLLI